MDKKRGIRNQGGSLGEMALPGGLQLTTGGLKYLGVFLGNDVSSRKNWEGMLEAVEGRLLKRWKWLLPRMSYRGRALMINNLVPSFLWHRVFVVDPPSGLLSWVQTVIVDFFWDRLHWLP